MSVLIETSIGDIVIDLYVKDCPKLALNFLKLCKIKYFNNCIFYDVQKDYIAQTGDPSNTGRDGNSIFGIINGEKYRYIEDEINPNLRHNKLGAVSTANFGANLNSSTFFIQLTNKNLSYLNEKHSVFGQVMEGLEILEKFNTVFVDKNNRPLQNIRIRHARILDDPFDDPKGMIVPSKSPEVIRDKELNRLEDDFDVNEYFKDKETMEKVAEKVQEHEAKNQAIVLEMLEDLPDADVRPPENVLFVCRLNPVTQDDDLELIFSRFGSIKSCKIIRDSKTGESLKYAFIEFEAVEACEQAYFKMNGVVIDERRIKVDFSQSVAKLWYNVKKSQDSLLKLEDKANELILPNEDKKYEIKANKNFMIDKNDKIRNTNKNYAMVFDEDRSKSRDKERENVKHRAHRDHRDHRDHDRHKEKASKKHKKRSRSRSRSRSRDKDRHRHRHSHK